MSCNEVHLSYEEQLNKFISRGMIVNNREKAIERLKHISYYKIKEFSLFFMNSDGTYKKDTYFEAVVQNFYYDKNLRKKVIVINENLDEFSMLIVLAHELGHALLHCSNDLQFLRSYTLLPRTSRLETEANKFAAELLLDDEMNFWGYEYNECGLGEKIFKDLIILKTNY